MNAGTRFVLCCLVVWLARFWRGSEALPCNADLGSKQNGSDLVLGHPPSSSSPSLEPKDALKVDCSSRELTANVTHRKKQENTMESKHKHHEEKPNILQRIGTFMMMIPVGMQLLQLPVAIASIKMSLLKSILVSKIALLVLFLRTVLLSGTREKVVFIHSPPKEHHQHYYIPYEDPEDSKPGWLGDTSWLG